MRVHGQIPAPDSSPVPTGIKPPLALLVVICHAYDAVLALRALLELAPGGLELARERLARTEVRADVPDLELRLGAGGRQGERVVW